MNYVCLHCEVTEVQMQGMKCFDCAAELAMHPVAKEASPKSTRTRSDGDTRRKPAKVAAEKGNEWQRLF